jgi:formylglycine-generating enzyme required for sulfatase activity
MRKRIVLCTIFIFLFMPLSTIAAEVQNTISRQVGNRVQFTYDLIGDEAEGDVDVTLTIQDKSYKATDLHLEGAFGKTPTGKGKVLWWNVLQDFPRGLEANVTWKIEVGRKIYVSHTLGAKFVLIPAGTFMMGDSRDTHQVTISKPFYLQTTETTQGQWKKVMGSNPSKFSSCGDDCPVEQVSWNDVREFINKLNRQEGTDKYRLPTEAEWEYSARSGGKQEKYAGTSSEPGLKDYAWYSANSGSTTHAVGQKKTNGFGLYDMSGNVWEWVQDCYGNYPSTHVTDPVVTSSGFYRVLRGGSWNYNASYCRSTNRDYDDPDNRTNYLGFRLLRTY